MRKISIKDVEYIAFRLAQETLEYNEPIPDFSSRFPNVLESCLAVPFQTFMKKSLYPKWLDKAGILFYLLIKNHPFQNGNKRIAMTTLLVFLYLNGKWIKVDIEALYNFTMWIAQSPPKMKEAAVNLIREFIAQHMVPAK